MTAIDYIALIPRAVGYRNVGEVSARVIYTLAFKVPSTANDRDLNLL